MKTYQISNMTTEETFNEILLAIDHGVEVTIKVGAELEQPIACKTAALGQPVFFDCHFWYAGAKETLENMLAYSPEDLIVNIYVQDGNHEEILKMIYEIVMDPKLADLKVCLIEPKLDDPSRYLDEQKWNELIVSCLDHRANLCWNYESASYRYVNYLRETTDAD